MGLRLKYLIGLLSGLLLVPSLALAVNVTVPLAPGSNYVLLSTSTGQYIDVATSSLGISGGSGGATFG